jgi:hypothetical protein
MERLHVLDRRLATRRHAQPSLTQRSREQIEGLPVVNADQVVALCHRHQDLNGAATSKRARDCQGELPLAVEHAPQE